MSGEKVTIKFWGYKHTSGTIHTKRFFDQMDISEAQESPFVARIMMPFEASGIDEAQEKVKQYFDERISPAS